MSTPDDLHPLADLDGEDGAEALDRVFGRGLSTWDPSRPTVVSTLDLERSAEP